MISVSQTTFFPRSLLLCVAVVGCATPDLRNVAVVEPGILVRSGQPTALGLAEARDTFGVRTVVNLNTSTVDEEMVTALALGLDYVALPTKTYQIERDHLILVLALIRQAEAEGRAPVLVHCRSGQDRTGAAVAIFRTLGQGQSVETAIEEQARYRHWTHDVLFPHLYGVVRNMNDFDDMWAEVLEKTGQVPVIRPPAPWPYEGAPPSSVNPHSDVTRSVVPGLL